MLQSSLTLALLRAIITEGTVYYDGIATDTLNLDALRSNVTIIPQVVSFVKLTYSISHTNNLALFSLNCSVDPSVTIWTPFLNRMMLFSTPPYVQPVSSRSKMRRQRTV